MSTDLEDDYKGSLIKIINSNYVQPNKIVSAPTISILGPGER